MLKMFSHHQPLLGYPFFFPFLCDKNYCSSNFSIVEFCFTISTVCRTLFRCNTFIKITDSCRKCSLSCHPRLLKTSGVSTFAVFLIILHNFHFFTIFSHCQNRQAAIPCTVLILGGNLTKGPSLSFFLSIYLSIFFLFLFFVSM
jgi:hypothetical protein